MVRGNRVRYVLQQHGLAGARRRNDQSTLTFSERCQQVHDAGAYVLFYGFEPEPLLRIQRRQVVEENLVAGLVGRLEVHRFDLDQREILFALMRRTYLAADGVTGFQIEFADLRRGNVNIVGARQIVVVGRAEEAITVRKDFKDTFGEDVAFLFALRLQDLENQILFAHAAGAGEVERAGNFSQLGYVLFFEFCNGHWFTCEG